MAGETILVVDDDEGTRRLIQKVLEPEGYRLLEAADPEQAEALFREQGGEIDLLLTDVVLPGGDGPDLYRSLSEERPLRVLYMSGYTRTVGERRYLLEGNPDFLAKPFTPGQLLARVKEII